MEALGDFSYPYDYFINGQPETHEFGKALKELGKYPDQPFKTLIIDGTTEVQRFAFRAVVPGMDVPPGHVVAGVERQQFGKVLAIMINWAYKFIQLDMNVILTSLEDERADAVGNTIRKPLLWGQSGGEIGSYTYLIARLAHISKLDTKQKAEMRESNLTIETDTTSVAFFNQGASFVAKDQYHMLDEEGKSIKYMMDPTIGKIWDAIQRNQNP
jgi:hypothetical protein